MRRSGFPLLLAAGLLFGASGAVDAQRAFEGVIVYEMDAGDVTMTMANHVKGTQIRQEIEGPMGSMISLVDTETMDMTMIMPAQKMYMKMNTGQMMQQMQSMQQQHSAVQPDPADLVATGRTETVAGQTCEHYTWSSDSGDMDMCIATGLGFMPFASPPSTNVMGAGARMNAFADAEKWRARFSDGFVPLLMTVTDGGKTMTMRATRVEPGSVDASLFAVPEGFTEMRMPGGR